MHTQFAPSEPILLDLLLEQIIEGCAGVGGLGGGGRGGFFFGGDTNRVERAVVLHIFARDAFGNGLHALETLGGIEVGALLAGMQFETALRAVIGNLSQRR